ncbi:M48 family metallopeptidase [Flavobacterium orientale]|uniref:Peptidase M48 domain-containing protein n=1 Tax=Flavobacterium orientale TaxID=1756020 RepID=A0A916Y6L9_9FLAO|nr:M48 family metallopeptidase [Flavobacterium orientale]GGD32743.1 hypothetical protein GCM10011343_23500 [Flavobacterium orientale]
MTIQISPEFKKQTAKAIAAIFLFVVFYLVLVLLVIAITIGCFYAGISLIVIKPMFFTLVIGIGLAGLGCMITVFLFKFLFKRNKTDLSNYMEVTRNDEPRLFSFIDEIVATTGTDFPKKVYLSSEVNASVFYDSSFWSMFFPIRKNLHIGMGLVNSITHDELKAIVAHEFGHFSQKSMKVGSYVYNVNQIIYNLLYDNESYYNLMSKVANSSNYFAFFVAIAQKIIQGIQWLLQKMYGIVNTSYLALSREMEFHADEVAANVTGYLPLKNSLLRLDLAEKGYHNVLNFYDGKQADALVSSNIFKEQEFVVHFLAAKQGIPVVNQFPDVQMKHIAHFNSSKLVVKNQWASHPELTDRISALERLNIEKSNPNNQPASTIFMDVEQTQQALTHKLFASVTYAITPQKHSLEAFQETFTAFYTKETFHEDFNGYYDQHSPVAFTTNDPPHSLATFDRLFSKEACSWSKELAILNSDLQLLEAIKNKTVAIANYDYEGIKHKAKEAPHTIAIIKENIALLQDKLKKNDQEIYIYFYTKAQEQGKLNDYKAVCDTYLDFDATYDANLALYTTLFERLAFTNDQNPHDKIYMNFVNFNPFEKQFKEALQQLLTRIALTDELPEATQNKISEFSTTRHTYFDGEKYLESNLELFYEMTHYFQYLNQRIYFLNKKKWLDYSLEIEGRITGI